MFSAILNGFNVRTDGMNIFYRIKENGNFFKVMIAMLAVTVLLCMVGGPIGEIFNCSRLALSEWPVVLIASLFIIPFDMIRKAITSLFKK
jgi:hypothetical protein